MLGAWAFIDAFFRFGFVGAGRLLLGPGSNFDLRPCRAAAVSGNAAVIRSVAFSRVSAHRSSIVDKYPLSVSFSNPVPRPFGSIRKKEIGSTCAY